MKRDDHDPLAGRPRRLGWRRCLLLLTGLALGWALHRASYPPHPGEALLREWLAHGEEATFRESWFGIPIHYRDQPLRGRPYDGCLRLAGALLHSPATRHAPRVADQLAADLVAYALDNPIFRQRLLAELLLPAMADPPRDLPRRFRLWLMGNGLKTTANPWPDFVTDSQLVWCERAIQQLRWRLPDWRVSQSDSVTYRLAPSLKAYAALQHRLQAFIDGELMRWQYRDDRSEYLPARPPLLEVNGSATVSLAAYQRLLGRSRGLLVDPGVPTYAGPGNLAQGLIIQVAHLARRTPEPPVAALMAISALRRDWDGCAEAYPVAVERPSAFTMVFAMMNAPELHSPELLLAATKFEGYFANRSPFMLVPALTQLHDQPHLLMPILERNHQLGQIADDAFEDPRFGLYHLVFWRKATSQYDQPYLRLHPNLPSEALPEVAATLAAILRQNPAALEHLEYGQSPPAALAKLTVADHAPALAHALTQIRKAQSEYEMQKAEALYELLRQGPQEIQQEIRRMLWHIARDPKTPPDDYRWLWPLARHPVVGDQALGTFLRQRWAHEWLPGMTPEAQRQAAEPGWLAFISLLPRSGTDPVAAFQELEHLVHQQYPKARPLLARFLEHENAIWPDALWRETLVECTEILNGPGKPTLQWWLSLALAEVWRRQDPRSFERLVDPLWLAPPHGFMDHWAARRIRDKLGGDNLERVLAMANEPQHWYTAERQGWGHLSSLLPASGGGEMGPLSALAYAPADSANLSRALITLAATSTGDMHHAKSLISPRSPGLAVDRTPLALTALVSDRELLRLRELRVKSWYEFHPLAEAVDAALAARHGWRRYRPWREPEPALRLAPAEHEPLPLPLPGWWREP